MEGMDFNAFKIPWTMYGSSAANFGLLRRGVRLNDDQVASWSVKGPASSPPWRLSGSRLARWAGCEFSAWPALRPVETLLK